MNRGRCRGGRGHHLTAAAIVLVFAAAGCADPTDTSTAPIATTPTPPAAGCNKVDFPLIDIPPRAHGEPTLKIPQPPGWEAFQTEGEEVIRFAQGNEALRANQYTPTVAVLLRSQQSHRSAQEQYDDERSELINSGLGAEFQSIYPATVCGQPAEITAYTTTLESRAPKFGKLLMAVAESENGTTHLVSLDIATTEPDNPVYQRDSQAILDGFVTLPSDSR